MAAEQMKRTNASAVVRSLLQAIEDAMEKGSTRLDVMEWINAQYGLNMNIKSFELALYRARKSAEKNGLHNPKENGLHNPKPEILPGNMTHNVEKQISDSGENVHAEKPEFKTIEDEGRSHLTQNDFSKIREESESEMDAVRKSIANKKRF